MDTLSRRKFLQMVGGAGAGTVATQLSNNLALEFIFRITR